MATADEILQYLPISYKTQDEENYVRFLWESFELNYEHEKYQFAFIAYHLLFMTYVYFQLWKIYSVIPHDFRKSILGLSKIREYFEELEERNRQNEAEGNALEQFYPFTFSDENESTIMILFHLVGCDKSKIGQYKKLIRDRNEIAHANGKMIFVSSRDIDKKIDEILRLVEEIHSHSKETSETCLLKFLEQSADIESRQYLDDIDEINETLLKGNYISPKNLNDLCKYPIENHLSDSNFKGMRGLFESILSRSAEFEC